MGATIDVFELTSRALRDLDKTDSKVEKKAVKESVKKTNTVKENKQPNKINYKKLKLESIRFAEDADEADFDYTPDEDVVLVIDTEMEEVPETEEDALAAAEELVGNTVCKCSICGANYICDCDTPIEEDIDGEITLVAEEDVCPICGEEAPQIIVGEIVADEETVEEPTEEPAEEVTDEETVEVTDEGNVEEVDVEDDFEVDDFDEECSTKSTKEAAEDKEDKEDKDTTKEATKRPIRKPIRRENTQTNVKKFVRRPANKVERVGKKISKSPVNEKVYRFNEVALNRLFTKFATENYSNVRAVKFDKGSFKGTTLTLEGIVTTVKGNKRNIKLVAENFKPTSGKMLLKIREEGPFTEGAIKVKNRVPFVVECVVKEDRVNPVSMKYAFNTKDTGLKEGKSNKTYKVYGQI